MKNDQRSEERNACSIEAKIILLRGSPTISSLITNISERGAQVEVAVEVELPDRFILAIPLFNDVYEEKQVELRWRVGFLVGVRFAKRDGGNT